MKTSLRVDNDLIRISHRLILLLCILYCSLPIVVGAEQEKDSVDSIGKPNEDFLVCEHADEFQQSNKDGVTTLTGNVRFKRVDGFLHAHKVRIYRNTETGETEKAIAEQNVKILDGDTLATCNHAILYFADDTMDLSGNVVVIQDEDRLESERFISERKTGKQVAEGKAKIHRPDGFLNGDKVVIHKNVETDELIRTIADGHVEIRDEQIFATSDHAIIEHVDGTVHLRDNVVVIQEEDRLESEEFSYNQRTGEKVGKGNVKFRVRINQQQKKQEPQTNKPQQENKKIVE